jgi:hypothetical protein
MYRDVTELLRVDPDLARPDTFDQALALIESDRRAVVDSDEVATRVLIALGLTEAEAADQVRISYGPLA